MRKYFWLTHELKNCNVTCYDRHSLVAALGVADALKVLAIALLLLSLTPFVAFAALDDVTLTTDANITVGGFTLNVSGSSAIVESITAGADNFSVVLRTGSSIKVSSSDRADFTVSASGGTVKREQVCGTNTSTLTLSESDDNVTVTVTPNSTCDAGGTYSGGGGGGGGGIITPTVPATTTAAATPATPAVPAETPAVPAVPSEAAQPSEVALAVSPVFNRTLSIGTSHADVKRLQQLLNSNPDTQLASDGLGSPGNETDFFGSLTRAAVQKFQAKYGIASSGDEASTGYGLVGPKTRAKLTEVFSGVSVPAESVAEPSPVAVEVSPVFNQSLEKGMSHADIKRLQELLNSDPDTQLASSGVGAPGNETNYFGSLTEAAVQKFQAKHGIASSGTPETTGYGRVGPQTREKLAEIFSAE